MQAALVALALLLVALAVAFSWLRQQVTRSGRLYRLLALGARRHPVMRRLWLAGSGAGRGELPLASWLLLVLALGGLDRKSTRLNSSHVRISYAVFCLKKKK